MRLSSKCRHLFILSLLVMLSGCGTFFNVQFSAPIVWSEGKAYTIQFTLDHDDQIARVDLYVKINDSSFERIVPERQGIYFLHTISKDRVVPGRIEYYSVILDLKNKEHPSAPVVVTVLSRAELTRAAEQNLLSKITHARTDRFPAGMDLDLVFTVASASATVLFFYSPDLQTDYVSIIPDRRGNNFYVTIPLAKLKKGMFRYYLKVEEPNPEFGTIGTYYPQSGDIQPVTVTIIGQDELPAALAEELSLAVKHVPPLEVPVISDCALSVQIDASKTPLLQRMLPRMTGGISVVLSYGREYQYSFPWREVRMLETGSMQYRASIPKYDLQAGADSYFFTVSVTMRETGRIVAENPMDGKRNPYKIRLLSLEEIRARRVEEILRRLSHTPPAEADGLTPLVLELAVKPADIPLRGILRIRRMQGRDYKDIVMTPSKNGIEGRIPVSDQEQGYTSYYFIVTAIYGDMGELTVNFPANGPASPFSYSIISKDVVLQRLTVDLAARISHTPVSKAQAGSDVTLSVKVNSMKPGTTVNLFIKTPSDRGFVATGMPYRGNEFTFTLEKNSVVAGDIQYYLEVNEPNTSFGNITVRQPEGAPSRPYIISVQQSPPTGGEPDSKPVYDSIRFTQVKESTPGRAGRIRIMIGHPATGIAVSLNYRFAGEAGFRTIEMTKTGVNYEADLPATMMLPEKQLEYWFVIKVPGINRDLDYPVDRQKPFVMDVKNPGGPR